ncbi:Aste57867_13032 [Aphanomyces stellatus]|uniref:Aste57867_13032 protein n=1 Tax=Aphanomyces stellatus TaxID=120398 RepID=A0A485KYR2_9STRA|nr:hypothetical protein As57867_012984 [Aphanomyces stellatus]VFT89877.1 Aste57867_13032 [Aphanomyces stellatus]
MLEVLYLWLSGWIWWIISILWSPWFFYSTALCLLFVCVYFDVILSAGLSSFGGAFVGPGIRIRWSFLHLTMSIENLVLQPGLLQTLDASAGLPMTLQNLEIGALSISANLFQQIWAFAAKKPLLEWGITIDGLKLALLADKASKWRWKAPDNKDRFDKSKEYAKTARLYQVEALTLLIIQKLEALAKPLMSTASTAKPSLTVRLQTQIQRLVDAWVDRFMLPWVDAVAQKVQVSITNLSVAVTPSTADAVMKFKWAAMRVCPARVVSDADLAEERLIELLGVGMTVDTAASAGTYVLHPFDVRVMASYASLCRGLLKSKKDVALAVVWRDLILQIEPAQLAVINDILAPMNDNAMWMAQAKLADEKMCKDVADAAAYQRDYAAAVADEKKPLYVKLGALVAKQCRVAGLYATWWVRGKLNYPRADTFAPPDDSVELRAARLRDVEQTSLVMDLVALRRDALGWTIPSFGEGLPTVAEKTKAAADLAKFIETPVDHYIPPPKPVVSALVETIAIEFTLGRVDLQCWADAQTHLIEFYVDTTTVTVRMTPTGMDIDLVIHSLGLNDLRQSKMNVFPHLLARNPDCGDMVRVALGMDGGNLTANVAVSDFSYLLVTSPLMQTMQAFTIEEDEETLVWREDPLPPPPPPALVYAAQIETTYNPSQLKVLGFAGVDATVLLKGCEICLLADPASKNSHILALTCDLDLKAERNLFYEAVTLTLSDVALEPCKIVLDKPVDNEITLELPGLRKLLELEGDGVDVELHYELRIAQPVVEERRASQVVEAPKPDTRRAWGVLKKAIQERNLPEMDQLPAAVEAPAPRPSIKEELFAERLFRLKVSDFALNVSKEDIGLFGAIQTRLGEQMEQTEDAMEAMVEKAARVAEARKARIDQELLDRLHDQFNSLDSDGGGSLDHKELMKLVQSLVADMGLTDEETKKCHEKLIKEVDADHSGDVSFDEFQAALNPVEETYALYHQGTVKLTAQEYANPRLKRSQVPKVHHLTGQPIHMNDSAAFAVFWKKMEDQTGVTKSTLNQQSPRIVQEKMIRVFKNYEYAQEAWLRLVNPGLKPSEQSPWLVLPHQVAGAGMATFEQKLTKGGTLETAAMNATAGVGGVPALGQMVPFEQQQVAIKTELHTEFGGFYFRMVDKMLPAHTPAMEFALEEMELHGTLTVQESDTKSSMDAGVLRFSMALYCKYYNTTARQLEPFIEYYPIQMVVKKEHDHDMECYLVSDKHLQLNLTATFMRALTTTQAAFYDAPVSPDEVTRKHIKELKGLCWVNNEVGVPFTFYVQSRHGSAVDLASRKADVEWHGYKECVLTNEEEDLKGAMAENLKEKEMRAAFRAADKDNSGELDAEEVHEVLRTVLKAYDALTSKEIDQQVRDFMVLADTDNSGLVSWKEFQVALAKTRTVAHRTLSIEVATYEPIHGITLDGLGEEVVMELIPTITMPWIEGNIESMYETGVAYLIQEDVSVDDLNRGVYLLHLVAEQDPRYKWTQSYLNDNEPKFCPRLLAIHITVDNTHGMTVTVKTAEYIRNETAKVTQMLLLDAAKQQSALNPSQDDGESFVVLQPYSNYSIPLPLIETGFFSVRQVGETSWSNDLALSVWPGRKTRQELTLFEPIDDQPTTIERFREGGWAIVLRPQLILLNTLPCVVEYKIVQRSDVLGDDNNDDDRLSVASTASRATGKSSKDKRPKFPTTVDNAWFDHVDQVNCRHMSIQSGASMQVSGLRLDQPAYMKIRLMVTKDNPVGGWSPQFQVATHVGMEKFNSIESVTLPAGPSISMKQMWTTKVPRTMEIFAPYWVQNRSGLDLKYKISKGAACTWEQHEAYFGAGFHTVPLLVQAPALKATISVLPYQPTPFEYDFQTDIAADVRKYLPDFKALKHSQAVDVTTVGTIGEISCGNTECVLGYEIVAAPSQFQLTKVLVLVPRYVVVSQVDRPLQFTPLTVTKPLPVDVAKINVLLKPKHNLLVYRFMGKDKHVPALRCRDAFVNETWPEPGTWSPVIPLNLKQPTCMWLRGPLGPAPYIELDVQPTGATTFVIVKDRTKAPAIRIENRSTQFALRYVQLGVKQAEEMVLPPMTWHSYAWDNPFEADVKLKVFVGTSRVPEHVDLMHMTKLNNLTPDGGRVQLHGEVYIDGNTRVLAVGDEPVFHENRRQAQEDMFRDMALDVGLHGVSITIVDNAPREVMNITMDGLRVTSPAQSTCMTYDLHHFQVDDMSRRAMYPIVICPTDSGFNSNKKEGWLVEHGEHPFFHMVSDSYTDANMLISDQFLVELGSMDIQLNLDYILDVLDVFFAILWPPQTEEEMEQAGIVAVEELLNKRLHVPDAASLGQLMYFKKCLIQSYHLNVVLNSNPEDSDSGLSKMLGATAGSIVGGIAHIQPSFFIQSISREDRFLYYDDFLRNTVIWESIVMGCISQWYKVVGSVELLGDPVGLVHEITDGFALAVRQTKRDFTGKSRSKGQGAVTLMKTVIGAPSGAIGKMSNGVGDLLKKATHFDSQEMENEPRHFPEGVLQGGMVFGMSLAHGVSGLVTKPMEGAKQNGFGGFAKGVGQGALGLVASPFVGAIGVVEKLSQSVHNTTHLMDEKYFEGTRRIARKGNLKAIEDSPLLAEVEIMMLKVAGVPLKSNIKVYVSLHELTTDPANRVGKLVDTFKSKTKRHAPGFAEINQSRIVDVTSLDMILVFDVVHKRKPLPRKTIGKVHLTMEQITELFPPMPTRFKTNSVIKEHLKTRKVHNGSIFQRCLEGGNAASPPNSTSSASSHKDMGWETAYLRATSIFEEERESLSTLARSPDNDRNHSMHSRRSSFHSHASEQHVVSPSSDNGKLPDFVKEFPLVGADEGAPTIFLGIRYFNTMRT